MKVSPIYPQDGTHVCPICGTKDKKQTMLVPIYGTQEAIPTHVNCIFTNISYSPEHQLMGLETKEGN